MANMLTIRQTRDRLMKDGLPLSEYSLRMLIKRGTIPVRFVGRKALIFYPNVVSYLQCVDGGDNPSLGM